MELEQRIKLIKKHQDTLKTQTQEKKEIFPASHKKKAVIDENSPIIQRLREDEERAKLRHLSDDELIEREFRDEADALRAQMVDNIESIKEYMEHNQTPQSRNFSSDLPHNVAEDFGLNIAESTQDLAIAMPKSQHLERIPLPKREQDSADLVDSANLQDSANLTERAQILAQSQNLAQDFSTSQTPLPTSQNQDLQNQTPPQTLPIAQTQTSQTQNPQTPQSPPAVPKIDLSNLQIKDFKPDFTPDFTNDSTPDFFTPPNATDSAPNTTPSIISDLASNQNSNEIVGIYTPQNADSTPYFAESTLRQDLPPNPPIYPPSFEPYNFDDGRTHRIEIVDKIDNYDIEFPKIKALYNDILGDNNIIDSTDDIDELNEINHSLVRAQKKLEERLKVAKIRQQLGDIKSITPIQSNEEFRVDLVRDSEVDSAKNIAVDSAPKISQNLTQTAPEIVQIKKEKIQEYGNDFFNLPQQASNFAPDSAENADSAEFVDDEDFAESQKNHFVILSNSEISQKNNRDSSLASLAQNDNLNADSAENFSQDFLEVMDNESALDSAPSVDSATFQAPPHFSYNSQNLERESQNLAHFQSTNGEFQLPPLDLLNPPFAQKIDIDDSEIDIKVQNLFNKLRVFKIEGDIVRTYSGPVVTTFEFRPAPNVKVSRIQNLQDDLSMALKATSIRIQAPIPGKDVVGIEIPNNKIQTIYLREVFESEEFRGANAHLPIALGKDVIGNPVIEDLAKLPHLLIAGTTGSGKSVGINAMILSLLYKHTPKDLRFIMIDPKFLEFGLYKDIPHLLTPIITDPKKAIIALSKAVEEMNRRYELMDKAKVKTIVGFNELAAQNGEEKLPYIVIIIDEFADLMIMGGREAEQFLISLAGKARASGIHLIIATQRPTVNVVTGLIKGNLPSKISYRVGSKIDSKVILDETGAEALLGRGDMLFSKTNNIVRLHAPYNDEREIERIVDFLKSQQEVQYDEFFSLEAKEPSAAPQPTQISSEGDYKERAKEIILQSGKTSISYLQRGLGVGFNKAASIIESLEKDGFLSPPNSKGVREILGD